MLAWLLAEINMLRAYHTQGLVEAGCDEVGRGCLAGPVVAAAVILPPEFEHENIRDSKSLSLDKRLEMDSLIRECALDFHIAECSPQEIDELNILQASFKAMHKAVSGLKTRPEHLLVDGNRFAPILGLPHTCVVKGDNVFRSIAAASILAKVHRDGLMLELHEMFPAYSWNTNVGYPTAAHRRAIKEIGPTEHHRKSFRLLPRSS